MLYVFFREELRRRVVMSARRGTWLVLLDCDVAPHAPSHALAALSTLPTTLTTPTIFCVVADEVSSAPALKVQSAVVGG